MDEIRQVNLEIENILMKPRTSRIRIPTRLNYQSIATPGFERPLLSDSKMPGSARSSLNFNN